MLSILSLIAQNNTIDLGGFTPPTDAYSKGSGSSANGAQALKNLELFISNIIGFMTALGGIFFVIYFVLGAFEWISSGGDKGKVENARNRITQAFIGLVVLVGSYVIIGFVSEIFFGESFNVLQINIPEPK